MTTPTLLFLEMSQPMNYLQSQAMHFLGPGVQAILREQNYAGYSVFARFLERRGAIDYLARRIEELEKARDAAPVGGGDG